MGPPLHPPSRGCTPETVEIYFKRLSKYVVNPKVDDIVDSWLQSEPLFHKANITKTFGVHSDSERLSSVTHKGLREESVHPARTVMLLFRVTRGGMEAAVVVVVAVATAVVLLAELVDASAHLSEAHTEVLK